MTKPPVIWYPSPNFNARPKGMKPEVIVIHHTGSDDTLSDVLTLTDPKSEVSAHYLIVPAGAIAHLVKDADRAWHAGLSEFQGRKDVNDFSIGIEITNRGDGLTPFTDAQYEACRTLVAWLMAEYSIPRENVVGHKDVAMPMGRKHDPAANFDWNRILPAAPKEET